MAQFDVHRNAGKQGEAIPYVVIVQSSLFDSYRRRVVIPLVRRSHLDNAALLAGLPLSPTFTVRDRSCTASAGNRLCGHGSVRRKVATLEQKGDRIAAAMDEMLTRAWA